MTDPDRRATVDLKGWALIATVIFSAGGFVTATRNGQAQSERQEPRIEALERRAGESEKAMAGIAEANKSAAEAIRAVMTSVERLTAEVRNHEIIDAKDNAVLQATAEEVRRMRDREQGR